jgi:hypothetical protein
VRVFDENTEEADVTHGIASIGVVHIRRWLEVDTGFSSTFVVSLGTQPVLAGSCIS